MGQSSVTRVLVVARRDPQDPIGASLKRAGYAVLQADKSLTATRSLEHDRPDVVVIHEHALGKRDVESLSAAAARCDVPVLVLSHATASATGSFGDSLALRIEALLAESRSGHVGAGETERLTVGTLVVDLDQHTAQLDGVPLSLTAKEFELLSHFARRPGRIWNRQQLIDLIWGYDYVEPRVVTVHIANLRRKLEEAAAAAIRIEAVRGVGYRLVCPSDLSAGRSRDHPAKGPAEPPSTRERRHDSDRLPFVGRERELEVLRRAVDVVMNGEVRSAAIVGDPGIGKTRLAEEAAAYAREGGASLYWGKCRDAPAKPVYEPWVEILEQWRRESPAGELDLVFVAEPPETVQSPLDAKSARLRLFDRLTDAIYRKAEAGALCLVLDDLQWADPSTLLALQYVIGHLRDVPLMLLLTYRPGDTARTPLLTEVMNDLVRGDLGVVLPLSSLSQREVGHFVALSGLDRRSSELASNPGPAPRGGATTNPELAAEVYRETEGNPFFMTQLMRLRLLEDESLESPPAGRTLSREEGVRRVVLSRLSRLSSSCREALDVASVIGRDFTGPVLAGTMDLAPEPLLERLDEALDTHILLVREDVAAGYRFVHSIFQEVLRDELSPRRRAALHAKVGAVLEHLHGDELDTYAADLAYHFFEAVPAGFAPQAVDFCLRAGRVAASQFAWDEACSHLRRAVELVDLLPAEAHQKDPLFAARVWEELGDIYYVSPDTGGALEAYQQAARRVPASEGLWQARLKEAMGRGHLSMERFDEAMAYFAEADALLGPPTEEAGTSWWNTWILVQTDRGWTHFQQGRFEELYTLLEQVEKTAGTHGGPRERGHFRRLQIIAEWTRRRFVSTSETLKLAQECANNFRAAGSSGELLYAERVLADALLYSPEKRGDTYDQLVRFWALARRSHSVWQQLPALWDLEIWHRLRGEVDAVHDHCLATLSLTSGRSGSFIQYGAEAKGHLSWVAWRAGDLGRARTLSAEALREIRGETYSPFEWQARWTLLGLGLLEEDWDEASRQAEAMLDQSQQKMPDDLEELLQRLVDEFAQGGPPSSETIVVLKKTAQAYGYL